MMAKHWNPTAIRSDLCRLPQTQISIAFCYVWLLSCYNMTMPYYIFIVPAKWLEFICHPNRFFCMVNPSMLESTNVDLMANGIMAMPVHADMLDIFAAVLACLNAIYTACFGCASASRDVPSGAPFQVLLPCSIAAVWHARWMLDISCWFTCCQLHTSNAKTA
eukprot:GHRR01032714.1.p1 GENE.GHRR01032714.1~~GHRR01032714.1.p1  ORF type:complete len:163 (-),score=20.19 GHRR01032714.1:54-542(-)